MYDNDFILNLVRDFTKDEVISILNELDIFEPDDMESNSRVLILKILKDIDDNGVPDVTTDLSDALMEFLVAAEIVDEEGNYIEEDEKSETEVNTKTEEESDSVAMPACWGMADIPRVDPACKGCSIYEDCAEDRISKRPTCYGLSYNKHECNLCIENFNCQKEMEQ